MKPFEASRPDGRSYQQVVVELVKDQEPGTLYTYDNISQTLSKGMDRILTKAEVQSAVNAAKRRLLWEQKRTLVSIRGVGYRLSHAQDHSPLALSHQRRSYVQMKRGITLLENVRWDELDENARNAHQGSLRSCTVYGHI